MKQQESWIVGIDIGGTNFRIGCVSQTGGLINATVVRSAFLGESQDAQAALCEYIADYLAKTGVDGVKGVCIGIPGSVSKDRRSTISVPNLCDSAGRHVFDGLNLADNIEKGLGIPVFLNKDVDHLLAFDIALNGLEQEEIVVGCYIGTGFGGSIRIGGKYLAGKNGVANEIGHIPYYKGELTCGCGKKACAECYASGSALKKMQEEFYPEDSIGDIFVKHAEDLRVVDFVKACALPIATEANIFDPDCMLIGGGVVNMQGFPKDKLKEFVLENTRKPLPAEDLRLLYSTQCEDMGVIGAALFAAERIGFDASQMLAGVKRSLKRADPQRFAAM